MGWSRGPGHGWGRSLGDGMGLWSLQKRYERLLHRLDVTIPVPFSVAEFTSGIARQRGKPILIYSTGRSAVVDRMCGALLTTKETDYILVHPDLPPFLRDHTVMHEVCHLLLGHGSVLRPDVIADLFPNLDPALVVRALARDKEYSASDEEEAESLARIVPVFAAIRQPVPRPGTEDHGVIGVMHRLSSSVAADRTWE